MCGGVALIDAQSRPGPAVGADSVADSLPDRIVRGQPHAFDELVAVYQPRISRLVHRLLGWRGDVDDVVQEVFLAALNHGHRFRGDASLATWLTAIAVNKCRSHQRRLRVLWDQFVRRPMEAVDSPSSMGAAEDALDGAETSARVREAVRRLSPRDREVVVLRYFDDLSAGEIANLTGQSKNAVEVRLHRARARLAVMLREVVNEDNRP